MRKYLVMLVVLVALVGTAIAFGDDNGNHNGQVGCTLANGDHYANPAEMLKALTERDGSFQYTVERYGFASVGDLIAQKCGVPEGFPAD